MIKYKVNDLETVDEKFRELYVKKGNDYVLDTDNVFQEDYEKTYSTLQKVRDEKKALEKQVKDLTSTVNGFGDFTPDSIKSMSNELNELRSKGDDVTKLKSMNADYKYQLEQLQESNKKVLEQLQAFEIERKNNTLRDSARKALKDKGVADYAMEDALLWASNQLSISDDGSVTIKEGVANMTAGLGVGSWAELLREQKPYLFGGSVGGGSNGSGSTLRLSEDWSTTGANGGINITKLSKAMIDKPNETIAIMKQKGIYDKMLKEKPYLFKLGK